MTSYLIRGAAIIAILVGTSISSMAAGGPFTRGCAARDSQVIMLLEQQDSADGIGAQKMREVLTAIFDARMVCFSGRVLDALAIYETVARHIVSERTASSCGSTLEVCSVLPPDGFLAETSPHAR